MSAFLDFDGKKVCLELCVYEHNRNLCIRLFVLEGGELEPYGSLTVNLDLNLPDQYGFVDINNMPDIEEFINKYQLGAFTGVCKTSGYCMYPLYLFDRQRLNELCY